MHQFVYPAWAVVNATPLPFCSAHILFITQRAKLSGAVYCNRSSLGFLFVCWVCYHDNSKLRAPILTKMGLQVKVVTVSN